MKLELKEFQTAAAINILTKLGQARQGVANGDHEAIVLSAPTGSGKTITVAAVIDWILGGTEGFPPRPNTTFLWLSDSPELNLQSKNKLIWACENLSFNRLVTVESETFDEEKLYPGHVYFINTQLLGKDKLLTKGGDKKTFTFWQTLANSIAAAPGDLVLIIDEAHRGSGVSDKARKPIMQKFITGSPADGLPPIPIVLGMSATPQKFHELLGSTTRITRPVNISTEAVRKSGLLKDLIVVTTNKLKTIQSDLTHLQTAAVQWKAMSARWQKYCNDNKEIVVRPVLVVQVQDGTEITLTATPLNDVVAVLQREMGPLAVNEIVHCFQGAADLNFGGCIIRKAEASRIQDATEVRVVLFKTALTTGWDCPRAEVMMSFRKAIDATSIAQLVGRMIRTPLARRVESDELLNTVELFLPHYDAENLEAVLKALRDPDAHDSIATDVTTQAIEYARNPALSDVFDELAKIHTYVVNRAPKMSDMRRVLRLSRLLVHNEIDENADETLRAKLTDKLKTLRDQYGKSGAEWEKMVKEGGEIDVDVSSVSLDDMTIAQQKTRRVALTSENVEQLFDEAGRLLAAGEGLHRSYWKRFHDVENPSRARLELYVVVRHNETLPSMEKLARSEFDDLWKAHKAAIKKLPPSEIARFNQLVQSSGKPEAVEWELPDCIVEKPGKEKFEDHLFVDKDGKFSTPLNEWEADFLHYARELDGFVGWLRNLPRKEWAFCIPYEHAGEKAFFPDFVIVRKKGTDYEFDILEPHDSTRTDTWAKAKGLAKFAEEHHLEFGHLMIGRKKDGKIQIVDVSKDKLRKRALQMGASADLEALFEDV